MNDVSPVTESEMTDWFRRLSTMIVGFSAQSQEIKRLQEDFAVANQRLDQVATDNNRLKSEVADTWRLMQDVEKERDSAKAEVVQVKQENEQTREHLARTVQDYDNRLQQAHDAMAARDQRIAALEAQVREAEGKANAAEQARAQVARDLEQSQGSVRYWTGRAEQSERERDGYHGAVDGQSRTIVTLTDKLTQVQAKLSEFRSLFEPEATS